MVRLNRRLLTKCMPNEIMGDSERCRAEVLQRNQALNTSAHLRFLSVSRCLLSVTQTWKALAWGTAPEATSWFFFNCDLFKAGELNLFSLLFCIYSTRPA